MHNPSNRRIRTRTYGGVGGAEPRGSPLSRFRPKLEHFSAKWNPVSRKKMLVTNNLRVCYSQNRYPLLRNMR